MMQNLLCALITLGQSTPQNLPPQTLAPVPSTQTNLHLCSQHIQWVQPGGPMGIPTTMPDHVQHSPSELYIRVSQGMLWMEIQLDRICQRALDPFQTRQSNRCGRGGTPTPNNVKQSLPL